MANNQRAVVIVLEEKDGKVTLSKGDFQRLLSHVIGREVTYQTQVSLKPKIVKKRGPKQKIEKA